MDRLACVDLKALPLQLLLKERPELREKPAAVVAQDRPSGLVLWANEPAIAAGVLPGQRYAAALSLAAGLLAAEVPERRIAGAVAQLTATLRLHSPGVEPAEGEPGVFFLDVAGFGRLHPSAGRWAKAVRDGLAAQGFTATVVAGFTRFGAYAAARSREGTVVFRSRAEEEQVAASVPLSRLGISAEVRDALSKLGVRTVGALLKLPAGELAGRFGPVAHRLHRLASGELPAPLQPRAEEVRFAGKLLLDDPDDSAERLLFLTKRLLDPILAQLAARALSVAELTLTLGLHHAPGRSEQLRPAVPTLDPAQLLGLLRLRLEAVELVAGVVELGLVATPAPASAEQLRLFLEGPKRDRAAADRALSRLRAELGDEAVVRARLKDGHLPEARFAFEPLEKLQEPEARTVARRQLVRRLHEKPVPLPARSRQEPDGWLLRGLVHGRVVRLTGPYELAGGWWSGDGVQRAYYFAELVRGELLWIFWDRRRRRWFLQGRVE